MSSVPLTLAEAVPLGTVMIQRLLDDAGIRSLAIKGPAFVALGVRPFRQSSDIDLILHPMDRRAASEVLVAAGWERITPTFPDDLNAVVFSSTWKHPVFPSTIDVHHAFSGVLDGARGFEAMWRSRTSVKVAHQHVRVPSTEQALILEALNVIKGSRPGGWDDAVGGLSWAAHVRLKEVQIAADAMGVGRTANTLIRALGGPGVVGPAPRDYRAWAASTGRSFNHRVVMYALTRRPSRLPWVLGKLLILDDESGARWAATRGVDYRNNAQIVAVRLRALLMRFLGMWS